MTPQLLGLGNAIIDLVFNVEATTINELGLTKASTTLIDGIKYDELNELLTQKYGKPQLFTGGSVANSIHFNKNAGIACSFASQVGNDDNGHFYTRSLGDSNALSVKDNTKTSSCIVLVTPDAERTMLTCISCGFCTSNPALSLASECDILLLEGYLWSDEANHNALKHTAQTAQKNGARVALSISDTFIANNFNNTIKDFIKHNCDLVFGNQAEFNALYGNKIPDFDDKVFVQTLGQNGCTLHCGGFSEHFGGHTVKAVDCTGAGDVFAGAFLFGLLSNFDFECSAILANKNAAQIVTQYGAQLQLHQMILNP